MMEANIKLDNLANQMFRILNQLHQLGVYERLQLYSGDSEFDERIANQLVSLNGLVNHAYLNSANHLKLRFSVMNVVIFSTPS